MSLAAAFSKISDPTQYDDVLTDLHTARSDAAPAAVAPAKAVAAPQAAPEVSKEQSGPATDPQAKAVTAVGSVTPSAAPRPAALSMGKAVAIPSSEEDRFVDEIGAGDGSLLITNSDDARVDLKKAPVSQVGFPVPPRPIGWPSFMAWPPARDMRALSNPQVIDEARRAYFARLVELDQFMIRRAAQVDAWIKANTPTRSGIPLPAPFDKVTRRARLRALDMENDRHYGIRWSMLLDPRNQNGPATQGVAAWSHTRAVMIDRGTVIVNAASVRVGRPSEMAMNLAIREAIARGWSDLTISGGSIMCEAAMRAVKEAGISATIKMPYGPGGLLTRTVRVMPDIPLPEGNPFLEAAAAAEAGEAGQDGEKSTRKEKVKIPDNGRDPMEETDESDLGPHA